MDGSVETLITKTTYIINIFIICIWTNILVDCYKPWNKNIFKNMNKKLTFTKYSYSFCQYGNNIAYYINDI